MLNRAAYSGAPYNSTLGVSETPVRRYGSWFLALLFVALWLWLLHFLAVDRCLDRGGGVAAGGMSCDVGVGDPISLFSYTGLFDALLAAVLAAIPIGLISSMIHSRRARGDTPNT